MEDDNRKEDQASTSKKEPKDRASGHDEDSDKERDDRTYTGTSASDISSVRSRLNMRADGRPDIPKPPIGKREKPERKKRVRRGRISKRRRSVIRRYANVRKMPKKIKVDKREREPSVSTIFTRMSSRSGSPSISCAYCGHRCCGRRLTVLELLKVRRDQRRHLVRKITEELRLMRQATADTKKKAQSKRKNKKQTGVQKKQTDVRKKRGILKKPQKSTKGRKHEKLSIYKKKRCFSADKKRVKSSHDVTVAQRIVLSGPSSGLEGNQVGSSCKMLSPLFIKTNAFLEENFQEEKMNYNEITPEMIFHTLLKLQKWRQYSLFDSIFDNIKLCYPVNPNKEELAIELAEKLRIAEISGIVTQAQFWNVNYWCLSCPIRKRGLTRNHVTLFWQAYGDTLSPVTKKHIVENENSTIS